MTSHAAPEAVHPAGSHRSSRPVSRTSASSTRTPLTSFAPRPGTRISPRAFQRLCSAKPGRPRRATRGVERHPRPQRTSVIESQNRWLIGVCQARQVFATAVRWSAPPAILRAEVCAPCARNGFADSYLGRCDRRAQRAAAEPIMDRDGPACPLWRPDTGHRLHRTAAGRRARKHPALLRPVGLLGAARGGWFGPHPRWRFGQANGVLRQALGTDLRGHRHLSGAFPILTDGGPSRASRRLHQAKCPQGRDVSERFRGSPLVGWNSEDEETKERRVSHLDHYDSFFQLTKETDDGNLRSTRAISASLEKAVANAGNPRLTATSF